MIGRIFERLVLFLCQTVNIATMILVPLAFLTPLGSATATLPYFGDVSLVKDAVVGLAAYMVLNIFTGIMRSGDPIDRRIDFTFSLLTALSIVGTAIAVFGFNYGAMYWGTIPNAKLVLALLAGYAIMIDLGFNQLRNWREVYQAGTGTHPAAAAPGAAPVHGRQEAFEDGVVTRRVIHRTQYFEQLPDGTLVPENAPGGWLVGYVDKFWDEDTPALPPPPGPAPAHGS